MLLGKVRNDHYMTRILETGAWRSCIACNAERRSAHVSAARTTEFIECQVCKASLTAESFNAAELRAWRKNRDLSRRAVCTKCREVRPRDCRVKTVTLQCSLCKKSLPMTMFDNAKVSEWRRSSATRQGAVRALHDADLGARSLAELHCLQRYHVVRTGQQGGQQGQHDRRHELPSM